MIETVSTTPFFYIQNQWEDENNSITNGAELKNVAFLMTYRLFNIPWIKIISSKSPTFTSRGPNHFNCVWLEKMALSEGRRIQIHQLGKSLLLKDPG